MTGNVDWGQLTFIVGLLVIVGGACGVGVWRFNAIMATQRHEMRSRYDQKMIVMEEKFEDREAGLEKRIRQLELFDAALNVILKQVDDFRGEVKDRFDALHKERKEDMQGLHRRLDVILNSQIDAKNERALKETRER